MSYFSAEEIFDGVFRIADPAGAFMTLLTGTDRALLVDTGFGFADIAAFVRTLTPLPLTVMNTHGHIDHIGGNRYFEEVFRCPLDSDIALLAYESWVKKRLAELRRSLLPEGYDEAEYLRLSDAARVFPLEGGMVFPLGGMTAEIIPMPGHTSGSVAVYCPERRLLISGDAIAPMVYQFFPESGTAEDYLKNLHTADALEIDSIQSAHTDRLIPKSELGLYIECAECYNIAETTRHRDDVFTNYSGRLYAHSWSKSPGEYAILVLGSDENKLSDNRSQNS